MSHQLPQTAEHVQREQSPMRLPADATDVCYRQYPRSGLILEFTTKEESFLEWARTKPGSAEAARAGVSLQRIAGEFTIQRYNMELGQAVIRQGWSFDWSNRDHVSRFAFDAKTGRVYYCRFLD